MTAVPRTPAIGHDAIGPVREAIDKLLTSHEPYPALIVDAFYPSDPATAAAVRAAWG